MYNSVIDMAKDILGSEFAQDLKKHMDSKAIIKAMMLSRSNISAEALSKSMGCTSEKVKYMERGLDDQLKICDLKKYFGALGIKVELVIDRSESTGSEYMRNNLQTIKIC